MSDDALFGLAVVVLLAAIALGYRRWAGAPGVSGVAGFVLISTAIGGLLGSIFWWFDLPASFAWDLPPVASRLLSAAAFAFGVAGIMVLERPTPSRIRLYFTVILVYLAPLAVAVLLLHLDRFDFAKPVTYGFFAVVVVLCSGAALVLARGGRPSRDAVAPPPFAAVWLAVAGSLLLAWGVALFVAPTTPMPLVFNWAQDPLTSRLIAAMLFALGATFLLSRRNDGLARVALVFAGVYGVGAAVACLFNIAASRPVPPLYALGLGLVGLVSAGLYLLLRSAKSSAGRASA